MRVYSARILLIVLTAFTLLAFQNCGKGFESSANSASNKLTVNGRVQTVVRLEVNGGAASGGFLEMVSVCDADSPQEQVTEVWMDGGPDVTSRELQGEFSAGRRNLSAVASYRTADGDLIHYYGNITVDLVSGVVNYVNINMSALPPDASGE